jgi:Ca-activated chloride channel family protein
MMIFFARPVYLFFLFVIPIIVFFHVISISLSKRKAIKFANFDAISRVKGVEVFSKNLTILYLHIALALFIVLSISGTSLVTQVQSTNQSFVLAIDASRSMTATDLLPTRLDVAKKAAADFLNMMPVQTRIGVLSFSGAVYVYSEMTTDAYQIKSAIDNIQIKEVGGTDFLSTFGEAANMLRDENSKTVILISDGSVNLNDLQTINDYLQKNNIIVYALGIGTPAGGSDSLGATYAFSSDTLKVIAENSGGKYYDITNLEDFYSSFSEILSLTKKNAIFDLSVYLMALALIILVVEFYLMNTRFRTLP